MRTRVAAPGGSKLAGPRTETRAPAIRALFGIGLTSLIAACSAPPSTSQQHASPSAEEATTPVLAYYEGTVDIARGTMEIVARSSSGAVTYETVPYDGGAATARHAMATARTASPETTLDYGQSAGDLYFHTCSTAVTNTTFSGAVQAVNLGGADTSDPVNAVIDSISATGVTLASGAGAGSPTGIIATYPSVPLNHADCSSSTTWLFSTPTTTNFTFTAHAEGVPPPPVCSIGVITWPNAGQAGQWQLSSPAQDTCAGGFTYQEYNSNCNAPCSDAVCPGGICTASLCQAECPAVSWDIVACPSNCAEPAYGGSTLTNASVPTAVSDGVPGGIPLPNIYYVLANQGDMCLANYPPPENVICGGPVVGSADSYFAPLGTPVTVNASSTGLAGDCWMNFQDFEWLVQHPTSFDAPPIPPNPNSSAWEFGDQYPMGNPSTNSGISPFNCTGCSSGANSLWPLSGNPPIPQVLLYPIGNVCAVKYPGVQLNNKFSSCTGSACKTNVCPSDPTNVTCHGKAIGWQDCVVARPDHCGGGSISYSGSNTPASTFYLAHQGTYFSDALAANQYESDLMNSVPNPFLPARVCQLNSPAPCLNVPGGPMPLPGQYPNSDVGLRASCITHEEDPLSTTYQLAVPINSVTESTAATAYGSSASGTTLAAGLAQQKFNDLLGSLAQASTSPPYAAAASTVYGYAKLLFELQGELLTKPQQASAWNMYLVDDDQNACRGPVSLPPGYLPPSTCFSSPSVPVSLNLGGSASVTYQVNPQLYLERALSACMLLGAKASSVGIATEYLPTCAALANSIPQSTVAIVAGVDYSGCHGTVIGSASGDQYADAGASVSCPCDFTAYKQAWRTAANTLLAKVIAGFQPSPVSSAYSSLTVQSADPGLQQQLALIDKWYRASESLYPSGSDRTQLWGDTSAIVGQLWAVLNNQAQAALTASVAGLSTAPTADISNIFFDTTLSIDQQLMESLFRVGQVNPSFPLLDGTLPMRGAPLLYLVGDVLQSVSNRLRFAGSFHDVACEFDTTSTGGGCANGGIRSEVDEMWGLFATLADGTTSAKQNTATYNAQVRAGWTDVFGAIGASRAQTLEAAAEDAYGVATYSPTLLAPGAAASSTTDPLPWTSPGAIVPTTASLTSVASGAIPPPAASLVSAILAAGGYANNYGKTGLFSQNVPNSIKVQLQSAVLASGSQAQLGFSETLSELGTQIAGYSAAQAKAVSAIQTEASTNTLAADTASKISQDVAKSAFLDSQNQGFEDSYAANSKAFGDIMTAFNVAFKSVTNGTSVDPTQSATVHVMTTNVTPSMANAGTTIDQIAVTPSGTGWGVSPYNTQGSKFISAKAGTILNVNTSGSWYPTCALQNSGVPDAYNAGKYLNISNLATAVSYGQGYFLNETGASNNSNTNSTVTANGWSGTESVDSSFQVCVDTSTGTPGFIGAIFGASAKIDTNTCLSTSADGTHSNTWTASSNSSNGTSGQLSASFNEGVNLSNTPFPTAPAGALLVVQTDPTTGTVLDATSVQPGNVTVLITQDTNVYLVDNDLAASNAKTPCTFPSAADQLVVTLNVVTPYSQYFTYMLTGMQKALADIQGREATLIAQGQVLPDDMTSISSIAAADLQKFIPAGVAIPQSLQTLFNEWVDAQKVQVEEQVQIAYNNYQKSLINVEVQGYQNDLAADATQQRYNQLLLSWALADMGANSQYAQTLTQLLNTVSEVYYPATQIKYPGFGAAFSASYASTLADLTTSLDYANITTQQATEAQALLSGVQSVYNSYVGTYPNTSSATLVALAFPNPAYTAMYGAAAPAGWDSLADGGLPTPLWTVADPGSSASLWNAFDNGTATTVTITPEELYQVGGSAILDCGKLTPVIDNMMLYIGLQNGDTRYSFNNGNQGSGLSPIGPGVQVPFTVHADEAFSNAAGLSFWEWDQLDIHAQGQLTGADLEIWAGQESYATVFANTAFAPQTGTGGVPTGTYAETQVALGMSPFITFDVNFKPAASKWASVQPSIPPGYAPPPPPIDLVLLMQVETVTGANITWLSACKSSAN